MPRLHTTHFGTLDYEESGVLLFEQGLPAFESEREFVVVERPESAPVVFLQSLRNPELVFVTLPVQTVDPGYVPAIAHEDLEALGLDPTRQPEEGREALLLLIVTIGDGGAPEATANLMAPVVINLATRRALQALQPSSGYSARHPLRAPG